MKTSRHSHSKEPEVQIFESLRSAYAPFANAGIFATIRMLEVSSSSCNQGRSQATAL
jgi:hypothetical protein